MSKRALSLLATASAPSAELLGQLPPNVAKYVQKWVDICQPKDIHVCDGSQRENEMMLKDMERRHVLKPLTKYDNCWLALTDPKDVARVESKTLISTDRERDTLAPHKRNVKPILGNWWSPNKLDHALAERYPGCMRGRTMYVVPFSMGPVGGPLSKLGVELTDSAYVAACMRIMTRMGKAPLEGMMNHDFVGCMHSVGYPLEPGEQDVPWPCDPVRTIISHLPEENEICSYGSGYGGNSLLGKKCLALRLGSILARNEGWLAEHMVIMGITNPQGKKRYVAAAFPSQCGKTNLAMLTPTLPGYKIDCVGDDIAWMRFDKEGRLRAINPEYGFFGVAPGTSHKTNAIAMDGIQTDTMFTNVAETADGGFYWEGLEEEVPASMPITDWHGKPWKRGESTNLAAHGNSRFCSPMINCPILDPQWESSEGVPIDAIIFGGRRPEGVPLVYQSFDWGHGVMVGAAMRSESTSAAEHKGKSVMHDPFAMRPFFGYNFGDYLSHWFNLPEDHPKQHIPKIFHVNWFRKGDDGKFLWPGFGENIRVLDWILRRVDGDEAAGQYSPVGYLPTQGHLNVDGLADPVDWDQLFSVKKEFWQNEMKTVDKFLDDHLGTDYPPEISHQVHQQLRRVDHWQEEN